VASFFIEKVGIVPTWDKMTRLQELEMIPLPTSDAQAER